MCMKGAHTILKQTKSRPLERNEIRSAEIASRLSEGTVLRSFRSSVQVVVATIVAAARRILYSEETDDAEVFQNAINNREFTNVMVGVEDTNVPDK